jgi:hypothetical protein
MKIKILKICFYLFIGAIVGNYSSKWYNIEGNETIEYKTVFQTDTCMIKSIDVVHLTKEKIKQEVIRDTLLVDYVPQIRAYSALFPVKHGNVSVSGEVLGEVLKMSVVADLDIPEVTNTITNTITKTKTITKNPGGLFVTAGLISKDAIGNVSNDDVRLINMTIRQTLRPSIGGVFVKKKMIAGYSYNFDSHQLFIGKKLF